MLRKKYDILRQISLEPHIRNQRVFLVEELTEEEIEALRRVELPPEADYPDDDYSDEETKLSATELLKDA